MTVRTAGAYAVPVRGPAFECRPHSPVITCGVWPGYGPVLELLGERLRTRLASHDGPEGFSSHRVVARIGCGLRRTKANIVMDSGAPILAAALT